MHSIVTRFRNYILTGAIVLIPVVTSLFVMYKLFAWLDNILPDITGIHFPVGVGMLALLLIMLFIGMLAKNFIGRRLIHLGNAFLASVPILNKIFLTIQQVLDFIVNPKKNIFGKVVLVEYPKDGCWCIGFVTTRETSEISEAVGKQMICVYVPTAPNPTSGFTLYVQQSKVLDVNLTPEIALKAIVSAGIVSSAKTDVSSTNQANIAGLIQNWRIAKNIARKHLIDPRD